MQANFETTAAWFETIMIRQLGLKMKVEGGMSILAFTTMLSYKT